MIESNTYQSLIEITNEGGGNVIAVNNPLSENINEGDQSLVSQIEGKLVPQSPLLGRACIYKIPHWLFKHNEKEFVPNLVSIGPFHHGKRDLQAMEEIKLWYLHCLFERKPTPETSLKNFVKEIRSIEKYCRECYEQKFDHLSSDEFVEMMVVDGCFIIELIRKTTEYSFMIKRGDPVFNMSGMLHHIKDDLFLLDNQIPWMVLKCLFNLTRAKDGNEPFPLHELSAHFFDDTTFHFFIDHQSDKAELENKHLLDLVRNTVVGSYMERIKGRDRLFWNPIPSVTELLQVGVKFERSELINKEEVLSITFKNGVMRIPPIIIQENGESLFRNLIAFERSEPWLPVYMISSYVLIFNDLIKSTKDVDFLIQNKIMFTNLSKKDTAAFFNRLCNTPIVPSFFWKLSKDVNEYYEARQRRRMLQMIERSSIWSISNAVVILLIFTFLQILYSILSYCKEL